jgi:hypothetical protein
VFVLGLLLACGDKEKPKPSASPPKATHKPVVVDHTQTAQQPAMQMPVPLWEKGKIAREVDAASAALHGYVVLDLGEPWVPYLFSDGVGEDGKPLTNSYRSTYLALARGEFPKDHHGARAAEDRYLELYGILPTLALLRERFEAIEKLECAKELDLAPLQSYEGLVTYVSNDVAKRQADDYRYFHGLVQQMMKKHGVATPEELSAENLEARDQERLNRYLRLAPDYLAIDAAQKRLKCEGFMEGKGRFIRGGLDWATHEALAELERKHRVYSWGYLGRDTVAVLRISPLEAERRAVLRILTERAIHAAGIIEDGSTSVKADGTPRTFQGGDGQPHPIPNLVAQLEDSIVQAFGLQTPESTLAWLRSLGDLPKDEHRYVAVQAPELPEYYDGSMELTLDYDRGDVWYDFPYDAQGRERAQPVQNRPRVTLSARYLDQKIPLARFGTTIGGWRSELVGDAVMWRYKDSPPGPRIWDEIVAAPVWLPPDSTPPRELLKKNLKRKNATDPAYFVNYHETGPSYASAYGLVAAYHHEYLERADGTILIGRDEGIRTHGSVDYMSIMRRHSHGCHRLHNHIAVRLMSFVLTHSPHKRKGETPIGFKKLLEYEDQSYMMEIDKGGYVFELEKPIKINVLEGRVRGDVKKPIELPVPKFNETIGAYVTPDGGAVELRGDTLVEVPMPVGDGDVPMPVPQPITPTAAPRALLPASVAPGAATPPARVAPRGMMPAPIATPPRAPASPRAPAPLTGSPRAPAPASR